MTISTLLGIGFAWAFAAIAIYYGRRKNWATWFVIGFALIAGIVGRASLDLLLWIA